jgi:hypothetical protein
VLYCQNLFSGENQFYIPVDHPDVHTTEQMIWGGYISDYRVRGSDGRNASASAHVDEPAHGGVVSMNASDYDLLAVDMDEQGDEGPPALVESC